MHLQTNTQQISYDHNSFDCWRCSAIVTFYEKLKSKRLPKIHEDCKFSYCSTTKKYGIISYLKHIEKNLKNNKPTKKASIPKCDRKLRPQKPTSSPTTLSRIESKRLKLRSRKSIETLEEKNSSRIESPKEIKKEETLPIIKKEVSSCSASIASESPPIEKAAKQPRIGTLKRRRYNLERLQGDEDYEDDLFSDKEISPYPKLIEIDSDNSDFCRASTPTGYRSLSPTEEKSKSPEIKDSFSQSEFNISRREAEEYLYRRNKKLKKCSKYEETEIPSPVKKTHKSDSKVRKTIENAIKILEIQKCKQEILRNGEEEEDDYFTDNSDDHK